MEKVTLLVLALVSSTFCASFPYSNLLWVKNPNVPGGMMPLVLEDTAKAGVPKADLTTVKYYLFTPANPDVGDELIIGDVEALQRSHFIPGAPLKFLAHGYQSGINTGYPSEVRQAYLTWNQDMNLILVNWKELADGLYNFAAANTKPVGQKSAELLAFLLSQGVVSIDQLHIQGISLGAHVAGITGSSLYNLTGLKAPRVSGYDPAMPLFIDLDDSDRIDPTDGDFVDVVHTAAGTLGMVQPRGTVDFYPNGGRIQPCACYWCAPDVSGSCSHFRAAYLNIESIEAVAIPGSARFRSCLCDSWEDYTSGSCPCEYTAEMGETCSTSAQPGSYYLRTNGAKPYAQG